LLTALSTLRIRLITLQHPTPTHPPQQHRSRLEEILASQADALDSNASHAELAAASAAAAAFRAKEEDDRRAVEEARSERFRRELSAAQDAIAALEAQQVGWGLGGAVAGCVRVGAPMTALNDDPSPHIQVVLSARSQQQQAAAASAANRVSALELQLVGGATGSSTACTAEPGGWQVPQLEPAPQAAAQQPASTSRTKSATTAAAVRHGCSGGSGGGSSIAERLTRVEDLLPQVLDDLMHQSEDERAAVSSKVRRLEGQLAEQIAAVREESSQVLRVALFDCVLGAEGLLTMLGPVQADAGLSALIIRLLPSIHSHTYSGPRCHSRRGTERRGGGHSSICQGV